MKWTDQITSTYDGPLYQLVEDERILAEVKAKDFGSHQHYIAYSECRVGEPKRLGRFTHLRAAKECAEKEASHAGFGE